MSQIDDVSENTIFYISKLKHSFYASFRGALSLIYIVSWSVIGNLHKIVELPAGNGHPKEVMELRRVFAQLPGCPIKNPGSSGLKP